MSLVKIKKAIKDGWHNVYEARVYVIDGRITEMMDVYGYHCVLLKRDEPGSEDYIQLNTNDWKGIKLTTFRSNMFNGDFLIQRIEKQESE